MRKKQLFGYWLEAPLLTNENSSFAWNWFTLYKVSFFFINFSNFIYVKFISNKYKKAAFISSWNCKESGVGGKEQCLFQNVFFFFEASSICILRSTISIKIHGFVIFMYTYWWWKCWNYCRLSSYVPKHRTLSLDAMKVKYSSASKDIKLYTDASTNGVKRNTAVVNQNVRVCFRFISVWLWMLFIFLNPPLCGLVFIPG